MLVDSAVGQYLAINDRTSLSPLLMCWTAAAVLRIALGSARGRDNHSGRRIADY